MHRTIWEKWNDPAWWTDQGIHALIGALVASLTLLLLLTPMPRAPVLNLALFLGGLSGLVRELIQNWMDPTNDTVDSTFDAMAHLIGAFALIFPLSFAL